MQLSEGESGIEDSKELNRTINAFKPRPFLSSSGKPHNDPNSLPLKLPQMSVAAVLTRGF